MRIIHSSDWHLGQSFYTKSRAAEHQAFLHWLVAQVTEHRVDALIVAGDIFDTGTPPSYARELFNRFVVALQPTGCALVIMSGNHDAVATLNESRALLACLNTRVVAGNDGEPPVWLLNDRSGQPGAIICAIPFLRPRDVIHSRAGQSGQDKQHALLEAIADHYQRLYQQALALRASQEKALPIIATGHLTTVGASTSDSVRDIYIGNLDAFPAQLFPPADYIALGHIHRPQIIAGNERIRYCGAPLALSFDEAGQPKQVNLVSFAADGAMQVDALQVPQTQPMRLIKGTLAQIEQQLLGYRDQPATPVVWLDIEVVADGYLNDIQQRIQQLAADLPVEILLLRRSREQTLPGLVPVHQETLNELTVGEVFERRLALTGSLAEPQRERVCQLFNQVAASIAGPDDLQEEMP